jgi:hypothetical protein
MRSPLGLFPRAIASDDKEGLKGLFYGAAIDLSTGVKDLII